MRLHRCLAVMLGTVILGVAGVVQADTLIGVLPSTPGGTDYQAYYDQTTNVTWLANANMNGLMTWSQANSWASGLDINGVTGWALPTTTQPDATCSYQYNPGGGFPIQGSGYNCTGSQMGNLFYKGLGGTAGTNFASSHNSNYDLFSNVRANLPYWSATECGAPCYYGDAWIFDFSSGSQGAISEANALYAWAVHSGDVGPPPVTGVPEPGELGLMGMAIVGAGLAARQRLALR